MLDKDAGGFLLVVVLELTWFLSEVWEIFDPEGGRIFNCDSEYS